MNKYTSYKKKQQGGNVDIASINQGTGIQFNQDFANQYFRDDTYVLPQQPQKDFMSLPVQDITSNGQWSDRKVWRTQRPEWFLGKKEPVEGVDYNVVPYSQWQTYQNSPEYQTYTGKMQQGGQMYAQQGAWNPSPYATTYPSMLNNFTSSPYLERPQTVTQPDFTGSPFPSSGSVTPATNYLESQYQFSNPDLNLTETERRQFTNQVTQPQTQYNDITRTNIINPYGGIDLESSLAYAGQGYGSGNYTQAGLGTGLSVLKGARNFLTGYASGKESQRVKNEMYDNLYNPNINYTYLQQGGEVGKITNGQLLTGQYLVDQGYGNVNLEGNEFVKRADTGDVQLVVGDSHIKNGKVGEGVDAFLQDGDKVLSNYTKIPPKNAKELKERYGISLKKNATFADAQKAYDKKIGVTKTTDDLSSYIEKFGKNSQTQDPVAKRLNDSVLSKEIEATQLKLNNLKEPQSLVFEELFQLQESLPKKGNPGELLDKNGKVIEETKNVAQQGGYQNFYNEYITSPKYKERLQIQGYKNPDQTIKDRLKNVKGIDVSYVEGLGSQYFPNNGDINIDKTELRKYNLPLQSTTSHEYSHGAGSMMNTSNKNLSLNSREIEEINARNQFRNIDTSSRNTKLSLEEKVDIDHNSLAPEAKADIDALRYRLKKDNIYDTGKQNFNQDVLNKAKKLYGKDEILKRNFKAFKDKDLIYLMNNIAFNDDNIETYAQQGGKIDEIAKKYGIPLERAQELVKMQQGGEMVQEQSSQQDQIIQFVAQSLQQGADPQQILQQLVESGVPQDQATQLIEGIMQQLQQVAPEQASAPEQEVVQDEMVAQQGGEKRYMQQAGQQELVYDVNTGRNTYRTSPRVFQSATEGKAYGVSDPQIALQNLYNNFPDLIASEFKDNVIIDDLGNVDFKKNIPLNKEQEIVRNFQKKADSRMRASAKTIIDNPKNFSPQMVEESKRYLEDETFLDKASDADDAAKKIRGFDSKLGNFTSGRYSLGLNLLTPEDLATAQKSGIKTFKQLKQSPLYDKLSDESKKRTAKVDSLIGDTDADFTISEVKVSPKTNEITATDTTIPVETRNITKNVIPFLPQDLRLAPSSLNPIAKEQIALGRIQPIKTTVEPYLASAESQRQSDVARVQASGLSPVQQEALLAQGLASSQLSANDAIAKTEQFNAQNQFTTDQFNIGQAAKEMITNAQFNQQYEQKVLGGLNALEQNWRNYYTEANLQNRQNYRDIENLNLVNSQQSNYQYIPGMGVQFINTRPTNLPVTPTLTQAEIDSMTADQYNNYIRTQTNRMNDVPSKYIKLKNNLLNLDGK